MTSLTDTDFRDCDAQVLVAQIGSGNIAAISGGRIVHRRTGITLPVDRGYSVTVDLHVSDTYVVRRMFIRAGRVWIKGEMTGVYGEDVGQVAYRASCFNNRHWCADDARQVTP